MELVVLELAAPFEIMLDSKYDKGVHIAYFYGAILMLLAVALGAFGAHALEATLSANGQLAVYATANEYHFYHALGLLAIGAITERNAQLVFIVKIVYLLLFGVLIFSGSLYLLALFDVAWLGAVTPIGGLCLIIAWGALAMSLAKAAHQ